MESKIIQYVKRGKPNNKRKVGVLVSGVVDGEVCIGWSLCNDLDKFDKDKALEIAKGRCVSNDRETYDIDDIPLSFFNHNTLYKFLVRMNTYYKKNELSGFVDYLFDIVDIKIDN